MGAPRRVLLVQPPIPRLNFDRRTGNIPPAAYLKPADADIGTARIDILPESTAAYPEDAAPVERIPAAGADMVGFTLC